MRIIATIGNQELLEREKTLFLCSKRTPIELYGQVFQWTDSLSERDCVVCFNSTEMEEEVMKALVVNEVPMILVVINRFRDVHNIQIERALKENRMLILVLKRDEPKGKGQTPRLRNEFVLGMVQHVVCGYVNKNGSVFSLLAGRKDVEYLMDEPIPLMAAEKDNRGQRWTVGDDKVLLRMFYEDMGIHAIKKQLQRTYLSIRQRIRSITLPEDVMKGREFEDYVLELFDVRENGDFTLKEWRGDKTLGDVCPENNRYPDFIFDYQGKGLAVECKWRERLTTISERTCSQPTNLPSISSLPMRVACPCSSCWASVVSLASQNCSTSFHYKRFLWFLTQANQSKISCGRPWNLCSRQTNSFY